MRIPDDLASLIRSDLPAFAQRAIARELLDLLITAPSVGEIPLEPQDWSDQWEIENDELWQVIDFFVAKNVLQIQQGSLHDTLVCPGLKSSSKTIKGKAKRMDMAEIRHKASQSRAADLSLQDVLPGSVKEITRCIALMERNDRLNKGYDGWLPTDRYGLDGMIYAITPDLITSLTGEFPQVDIQSAFALMFDDLRFERQTRPTVPNASYWIRHWLKKNGDSVTRLDESDGQPQNIVITEFEY
jgi:hypothetical protein